MRNRGFSARRKTVIVIVILIGLVFSVRLAFLQLIDESYKISSHNNSRRDVTIYPGRGTIFDRKSRELVVNEATYDLMVIPRQARVVDTSELCMIIGIDKETYIRRMEKAKSFSRLRPSVFEKQISKETAGYIQEKLYKYPGFFLQNRTLRKYPRAIAAHLFGYIGEVDSARVAEDSYYRPGDYIGISGIEKSYEMQLRGVKGVRKMLVDVHNREKGSFMNGMYDTLAIPGLDLYTAIDADLQEYGEKLMQNKKGSIVAIDPQSGEILCLVSSPSYDPNLFVGRIRASNYVKLMADKQKPLYNRALMASYPPGSTFKMINALVGQQEGVLKPETRYPCNMGFSFGGLTVGCHAHPSPLDLQQSIQHSCNAYYCYAFRAIIDNKRYPKTRDAYMAWRKQVMSFGLGDRFGSDLPFELTGNIPSPEYYDRYHGKNRWKSITIISLAIGQGEILITPLQLANLAAIIGNRGYYYTPHVVRAIGKPELLLSTYNKKRYTSVEPRHFELVVNAMHDVVLAGTARIAHIDSIEVCGKTGTAQNPHGKNHSVFIAFAPKDNPRIAISVFVENSGYGATWAAPIASLMIEKYLKNYIPEKRKYLEENMFNGNLIDSP